MSLISLEHQSGKAFTVSVGGRELVTDASVEDGGEGRGPKPVELFVAALGSCIGMVVVTYCQHAGLPYEGMEVDLAFDFAANPSRIGSIAVDITMPEGFPESRREALTRAAKACPVHNTLHLPPEISVEVAD